MRTEYVLIFECCGNKITLGDDGRVGAHDQFCLACDTENPKTNVKRGVK